MGSCAAETMLESLEITIPALEPPSDNDAEIDLNDLLHDSFVFHHNGRRRRLNKSLADSDSLSTFENSSLASSFRSDALQRQWSGTSQFQHGEQYLPQRKRVRFGLDGDGEPFAEEYEADGPLSDEEKLAMWWQPMEFKLFRRYCQRAAEIARRSDYSDKFRRTYDVCGEKHVQDLTEFCDVSRVSIRGLEAIVFPTLVQARRLVVQGVVMTQSKIDPALTYDERAKILAAASKCLSGRARVLARVFGVGDEEVAKDCYYSMEKTSSSRSFCC